MKLAYPILAVLSLAVLPGCGSSISSLCADICDCRGCSDNELDDCIDDLEDLERYAEHEGCLDDFDALLDCSADEFECRGDDVDIDGCGNENGDLYRCLD